MFVKFGSNKDFPSFDFKHTTHIMELRDNQKRGKEALLAFYILLAFWCFNNFLQWIVFDLIKKNSSDGTVYLNEVILGLNAIYNLAYLLCIIFFLKWFRRAYYNLHQLKIIPLTYSEGWAVGGWFVPLLNLVAPYVVMKEIWKYTQIKADHRPLKSNLIVKIWWITFIIRPLITLSFTYGFLSISMDFNSFYVYFFTITINVFTLIAFLLIIRIIKQVVYWENIIYTGDNGMAIEDHLLSMD